MSNIELTYPTIDVVVKGETITVKPFGFGQIPKVTKLVAAVAASMPQGDVTIPQLLAEGGEGVIEVLAFAVRKPVDWFEDIHDWSQAVALLTAVVELNQEQFVKNVLPAVQQFMPKLPAPEMTVEAAPV